MNWLKHNWLWTIINSVAAGLFGSFLWQAASENFAGQALHHLVGSTGNFAIIFLLLSLAMTPLHIVFNWRGGLPLKKSTGLWAFAFAVAHLLFFAIQQGTILAAFSDFFVIIGLIPLLIMLPLAITSTQWWMRTLGKWWKPLHKTVYLAGITAAIHTVMAGNVLLAGLIVLALVVRIPAIKQWFTSRHQPGKRIPSAIPQPRTALQPSALAQ
ncbi:MAG: ferric reductase-like transmembrane domain-containing protein [Caldilineaceae bacterium]